MDRRLLRDEKLWLKGKMGGHAGFTSPEDWGLEILEPSDTEASRMFRVACLGVDLLVEGAAFPENFPATKRRVRKRGARLIADELMAERGERAAVLLTHAIPAYEVGWWRGFHYASVGEPEAYFQDPVWHEQVRQRLAAYYPLDADGEERLARCALRHRARTGEVATTFILEDTGFTRALKDGADKTELLGLANGHRLGADQSFEVEALHQALRICAGDEDYEHLEPLCHGRFVAQISDTRTRNRGSGRATWEATLAPRIDRYPAAGAESWSVPDHPGP